MDLKPRRGARCVAATTVAGQDVVEFSRRQQQRRVASPRCYTGRSVAYRRNSGVKPMVGTVSFGHLRVLVSALPIRGPSVGPKPPVLNLTALKTPWVS